MPGAVLAVGVVACAAAAAVGLAVVAGAAMTGQRLAAAADAAALAAADAASGAVSGIPCDRAREVAVAVGADLIRCDGDGLVMTVTVTAPFGPFAAEASARAGPPPSAP